MFVILRKDTAFCSNMQTLTHFFVFFLHFVPIVSFIERKKQLKPHTDINLQNNWRLGRANIMKKPEWYFLAEGTIIAEAIFGKGTKLEIPESIDR